MLFKQRKPRKFRYTPKNLKQERGESSNDLKSRWKDLRSHDSSAGIKSKSLFLLIAALGMIIVLWYILSKYEI